MLEQLGLILVQQVRTFRDDHLELLRQGALELARTPALTEEQQRSPTALGRGRRDAGRGLVQESLATGFQALVVLVVAGGADGGAPTRIPGRGRLSFVPLAAGEPELPIVDPLEESERTFAHRY